MFVAVLSVLALQAAPPTLAQPAGPSSQVTPSGAIQVVVGDRVTVRLPADGKPQQVSVEPAAAGAAQPPRPGAGKFDDTRHGTVVITLQKVGDGDLMMKVESGIDQAFDYRAVLVHEVSAGRWTGEPTSVCTVLPLLSSYEHWPKRPQARGIILSDFALRNTNGVVCPAPSKASK
ncbi:hypothetical protein [Phenylobacterium sp.]|jgi:hypothetical protein|uniref:hypothetical protein n=1 Tax=Phenylobacterium sp. TaxID=1871053 RepID=UPI002F91EF24